MPTQPNLESEQAQRETTPPAEEGSEDQHSASSPRRKGLTFEPVFAYEQMLVVHPEHRLSTAAFVEPYELADEVLITYPVPTERLDVFSHFLTPAGVLPRRHKLIEATEIMLQMIACGRGVGALPGWLVLEQQSQFAICPVRIGPEGIHKNLYLGIRCQDLKIDYMKAFVEVSKSGILRT